MTESRVQRRLAAILAADVAGYSRLMGADEEGTLAGLKAHRRELVDPVITEHRGRIVKTTGDGMLVEFASVVDGLRCAVELQRGMLARNAAVAPDRRIEFRIGLNVGDVIIDGDDLYGDGVNVAARLEGLAEPGGICISGRVQEDARGKLDVAFDDTGEQRLKNIDQPVRVYRVRIGGNAATPRHGPALPAKPSIAVLPFQNMSGDAEQEYFVDGLVEEIITALARFRGLFVIARNSSFTYKGRAVDIMQVGRELGVRYVLEGSVRRAGPKVRITGQLLDAATGAHLWADRFDGDVADIFDLQDDVAASVVGAIAPKLEEAEIERARRKPTESLDAYDNFLRGMAEFHLWTPASNDEALRHFYRAIELDPKFAAAYGLAARTYTQRHTGGWGADRPTEMVEVERLARRAADLGRHDAVALCTAGFALLDIVSALEYADKLIERALELNANLAWAWLYSGWAKVCLGLPEVAIERTQRAMRLSPQDPQIVSMQAAMASAHMIAGRYAEALTWSEAAIRERPNMRLGYGIAAASAAFAGRMDEAQSAIARLRELAPEFRLSDTKEMITFRRPDDTARLREGLRKAGLPE